MKNKKSQILFIYIGILMLILLGGYLVHFKAKKLRLFIK